MLELLGFLDSLFAGLACASFRYLEPWQAPFCLRAVAASKSWLVCCQKGSSQCQQAARHRQPQRSCISCSILHPNCRHFLPVQLFNSPVFFGDVPTIALLRGTGRLVRVIGFTKCDVGSMDWIGIRSNYIVLALGSWLLLALILFFSSWLLALVL